VKYLAEDAELKAKIAANVSTVRFAYDLTNNVYDEEVLADGPFWKVFPRVGRVSLLV
jgi:hypothetical protein